MVNELPPPPQPDYIYHWSPTPRRASIQRRGLVLGRKGVVSGTWKAPVLCFGVDPKGAWLLSGEAEAGRGIEEWDLWSVDTGCLDGYYWEAIPFDDGSVREYRIYQDIPKNALWRVGSRKREQ